jgi:hypothetical protein
MKKFRIIERVNSYGDVLHYCIQKKFLFFWVSTPYVFYASEINAKLRVLDKVHELEKRSRIDVIYQTGEED